MCIFGACAVLCGITSLWVPETALRHLYQTTVEAEEAHEDYGIPLLKKRREAKAETEIADAEKLMVEADKAKDTDPVVA